MLYNKQSTLKEGQALYSTVHTYCFVNSTSLKLSSKLYIAMESGNGNFEWGGGGNRGVEGRAC